MDRNKKADVAAELAAAVLRSQGRPVDEDEAVAVFRRVLDRLDGSETDGEPGVVL